MQVRPRLAGSPGGWTVQFGIPSYNEGAFVVRALDSIREAALCCGLQELSFILSDSSGTPRTVELAGEWADETGTELLVDRSEVRRSCKEARNVLMERAEADILIQIDADVAVARSSIAYLLLALTGHPEAEVASGCVLADPRCSGLRYRASAWQLKLNRRIASLLPDDEVRIEGAIWGARRSFYSGYRIPIGSGSIQDNVELDRYIKRASVPTRNCWRAAAYKIPARSLEDFFLQTHRYYAAVGEEPRRSFEPSKALRAAIVEGARDPLGMLLYAHARAWSMARTRRNRGAFTEYWDITPSTKSL
jgi:glycosyltransferase involved in cell wall biosynthesis